MKFKYIEIRIWDGEEDFDSSFTYDIPRSLAVEKFKRLLQEDTYFSYEEKMFEINKIEKMTNEELGNECTLSGMIPDAYFHEIID